MGTIAKEKRQPLIDTIIVVCRQYNYKIGHLKGQKPSEFWNQVMAKLPTDEISWPDNVSYYRNVWIDIQQDVVNALKSDANKSITTTKHQQSEQTSLLPSESPEPSLQPTSVSRDEIVHVVNEVLSERILELKQAIQINQDSLLLPPARVKVKGDKKVPKETRIHLPFSTTCDARLMELFDRECLKRKMKRSELLDAILYTFFDKPKMSGE